MATKTSNRQKDLEKYKQALGYSPSEYQERIFNFVLHGTGNAVVKARAGSGKTSTAIAAMKLVPEKKSCLFLAFNKSVQFEIEEKLRGYDNCRVRTVHSLGLSIIKSNLPGNIEIDDYKYSTYLKKNVGNMVKNIDISNKKEISAFIERTLSLLKFARLNLAQNTREITRVANKYEIETKNGEAEAVYQLMGYGRSNVSSIDYTDMVWLPCDMDMNSKYAKFDWIFNDEAQDYASAYVKLFMKCFKRGTRFISIGDDLQAINFFAGASETAFQTMVNQPNTELFELPISYRCDVAIIKEANDIVPDIYPRPGAGPGEVIHDSHISDIKINDMVLSRTNAPLIKMYTILVDRNVPCYIKGKDEDKIKLISTIEHFSVGEELGKNLDRDGLFPRMYDDMVNERNKMLERGLDNGDAINSPTVQSKYDTIVTLSTIAKKCGTKKQLIDRIEKIYSTTDTGVCLSTIHKAKGLEADNVHIVLRSTMPSKTAKTKYEIQQEQNLIYVAVTRPRHKLFYVSEIEFPPSRAFGDESDILTEFQYIENKVCRIYGKKPYIEMSNGTMAKFRLTEATKIGDLHKFDNRKTVTKTNKYKKKSLLEDIL